VREQLTQGKSDAEIMEFVVARYGEFVLLKPRLTAGTILLWATPFAVLLIAGTMLLLRRRRAESAPETPLTEAERQALQRAIE
jgi:cytochrome c-type biogenesis protein CcmH